MKISFLIVVLINCFFAGKGANQVRGSCAVWCRVALKLFVCDGTGCGVREAGTQGRAGSGEHHHQGGHRHLRHQHHRQLQLRRARHFLRAQVRTFMNTTHPHTTHAPATHVKLPAHARTTGRVRPRPAWRPFMWTTTATTRSSS